MSVAAPSAEPMDEELSASATEEASVTSPSDEAIESSMEESDEEVTVTLWCSGDAPHSPQQHNFEGTWKLYKASHRTNRPTYEHTAPGGTAVFLYFVDQVGSGPCPRWVIGPEPEGDGMNGWAYTDSSAVRPEDIIEPWLSWVKETAEWGEARLAFSKRSAEIGDESGASDDDDTEMAPDGAPVLDGEKKKKKSGKKKGAGKGGGKGAKGSSGKAKKAAGGDAKKAAAAKGKGGK